MSGSSGTATNSLARQNGRPTRRHFAPAAWRFSPKVTVAFLGLADLTEIAASALVHGSEVYGQILPKGPLEMVVAKEELTVFEADEDGEDVDESA